MLKNLCLLMLITPSVGLAITERQATIATYAPLATALGAAVIKRGDDRAVAWILGAGALATMGTRWICSRFTPSGQFDRANLMIEAATKLRSGEFNGFGRSGQVVFHVAMGARELLDKAEKDGICSSDLTHLRKRTNGLTQGIWHGDCTQDQHLEHKKAANDIYRKAFLGRWFLGI